MQLLNASKVFATDPAGITTKTNLQDRGRAVHGTFELLHFH